MIRWAGRMFRREWRQQILVVTLLTVAVAAAVGSITIVYNAAPADNAEFGSADHLLRLDGADPRKLEAGVASAERAFGTTEVIGHRSVSVPGSVETVDFRAQDPNGAYGGELLAIRRGSYPARPGEVAVTDGVAELLRLEIGSTLALDGHRRSVVGIVENPRKLSDEFALVSPSSAGPPDHVTVLVDASDASIDSFISGSLADGSAFTGSEDRPDNRAADTLAMFSVATVFLLLASLIAGRGLRSRRAATAPPARHARRHRRHTEAPAPRARGQRRHRRGDRRSLRDDRRPRSSGSPSPRRSSPPSTIASTGSAFRGR